jgi:hypothetical protein
MSCMQYRGSPNLVATASEWVPALKIRLLKHVGEHIRNRTSDMFIRSRVKHLFSPAFTPEDPRSAQ